ncbi:hypothetical protein LEAN103870_01330 [Legionella anisa]
MANRMVLLVLSVVVRSLTSVRNEPEMRADVSTELTIRLSASLN